MVAMSECLRDGRPGACSEIWHDTTRKLALVFFPLVGAPGRRGPRNHPAAVHGEVRGEHSPLRGLVDDRPVRRASRPTACCACMRRRARCCCSTCFRLAAVGTLIALLLPPFQLMGAVPATVAAAFVARGAGLVVVRQADRNGRSRAAPMARSLAGILAAAARSVAPAFAVRGWAARCRLLPRLALTGARFRGRVPWLLFRTGILRATKSVWPLTSWTGAVGPVTESRTERPERFSAYVWNCRDNRFRRASRGARRTCWAMCAAIVHRGPDDGGHYVRGPSGWACAG